MWEISIVSARECETKLYHHPTTTTTPETSNADAGGFYLIWSKPSKMHKSLVDIRISILHF